MTIDNELIDNLLKDYQKPEDLIGENRLLGGVKIFDTTTKRSGPGELRNEL